MLCDFCHKNEAVLRIQAVVGEAVQEADKTVNFCCACATERGILQGGGDSIDVGAMLHSLTSDALAKGQEPTSREQAPEVARCNACGLTATEFRKEGRLGCAHCYEALAALVTAGFSELHRGTAHVGRSPRGKGDGHPGSGPQGVAQQVAADALRRELEDAIAAQAYERASELRDQISRLRSAQEGKSSP